MRSVRSGFGDDEIGPMGVLPLQVVDTDLEPVVGVSFEQCSAMGSGERYQGVDPCVCNGHSICEMQKAIFSRGFVGVTGSDVPGRCDRVRRVSLPPDRMLGWNAITTAGPSF